MEGIVGKMQQAEVIETGDSPLVLATQGLSIEDTIRALDVAEFSYRFPTPRS